MSAIGYVTRHADGFKGQARALTIRAGIEIVPTPPGPRRVSLTTERRARFAELGAGWIKTREPSAKDYVSLGLAAPEFGPRRIYVNLGRAAGQDDEDVFALICNPVD